MGKRLAKLGAVAIKNSVYVLPDTEASYEDLQWLARGIVADGGDATMCRASFVEGLRDEQIEALFGAAREADFHALAEDARGVLACTFEVLVDAFDLREAGLSPIAEIVHDIDVKDGKFGRVEAAGIATVLAGIAVSHGEDADRIALGSTFFDVLFELFRRKRT